MLKYATPETAKRLKIYEMKLKKKKILKNNNDWFYKNGVNNYFL